MASRFQRAYAGASAAAAASAGGGGGECDSASGSSDSQFTENDDDELTLLDACLECDDDGLFELVQNGTTTELVNEQDKSGRVSQWYSK